jgi:hypothetical protein
MRPIRCHVLFYELDVAVERFLLLVRVFSEVFDGLDGRVHPTAHRSAEGRQGPESCMKADV